MPIQTKAASILHSHYRIKNCLQSSTIQGFKLALTIRLASVVLLKMLPAEHSHTAKMIGLTSNDYDFLMSLLTGNKFLPHMWKMEKGNFRIK